MTGSRLDIDRNDKLFDLAVRDAYRLFNGRLLSTPGSADDLDDGNVPEMPAELDDKVLMTIRRLERRRHHSQACRFARRAAVIVLVVLIVSGGALMNVRAFREEAVRFWINWSGQLVQIVLNPDAQESQGTASDPTAAAAVFYQPGYLPEDLACVKDITNTAGRWRLLVYRSADGLRSLTFNQSFVSGGGTLSIDTEYSGSEEVTVGGLRGILVTSAVPGEGENKLWWKDQSMSFLISSNLAPEEIIRVAESLKIEP